MLVSRQQRRETNTESVRALLEPREEVRLPSLFREVSTHQIRSPGEDTRERKRGGPSGSRTRFKRQRGIGEQNRVACKDCALRPGRND